MKVILTVEVEAPICSNCGNMGMGPGNAEKLDGAIKASITEQIKLAASKIRDLHDVDQKEIAKRLGGTAEYLSEVKNSTRSR